MGKWPIGTHEPQTSLKVEGLTDFAGRAEYRLRGLPDEQRSAHAFGNQQQAGNQQTRRNRDHQPAQTIEIIERTAAHKIGQHHVDRLASPGLDPDAHIVILRERDRHPECGNQHA